MNNVYYLEYGSYEYILEKSPLEGLSNQSAKFRLLIEDGYSSSYFYTVLYSRKLRGDMWVRGNNITLLLNAEQYPLLRLLMQKNEYDLPEGYVFA